VRHVTHLRLVHHAQPLPERLDTALDVFDTKDGAVSIAAPTPHHWAVLCGIIGRVELIDDPRTLGSGETGGHVAAPIFRDFMAAALKDVPAKPFPVAPGAALMASASKGKSGAAASREDPANLDEDNPDPDDRAAADPDYRGSTTQGRTGQGTRDYAEPTTPDYVSPYGASPSWAPPSWPGYASPRGRGYAAAQVPDDEPSRAPRIAGYPAPRPGYGSGYAAPPRYSVPAWARPSGGTGGLY